MRFFKRTALLPAIALALVAAPSAGHATTTTERTGAIKAVWNEVVAATELDWDCSSEPAAIVDGGLQGLDAYVYKLPEGSAGQRIAMTYLRTLNDTEAMSAVILTIPDIDWYFYDADCNSIDDTSMATATALEHGTVPADAKWVIAYLFAGPPSYFTVEIDSVTA